MWHKVSLIHRLDRSKGSDPVPLRNKPTVSPEDEHGQRRTKFCLGQKIPFMKSNFCCKIIKPVQVCSVCLRKFKHKSYRKLEGKIFQNKSKTNHSCLLLFLWCLTLTVHLPNDPKVSKFSRWDTDYRSQSSSENTRNCFIHLEFYQSYSRFDWGEKQKSVYPQDANRWTHNSKI